jgi:hypothetical protein
MIPVRENSEVVIKFTQINDIRWHNLIVSPNDVPLKVVVQINDPIIKKKYE